MSYWEQLKLQISVTPEGIYWHSDAVADMEKVQKSVVMKQLDEKLKGTDFIRVIIDDSKYHRGQKIDYKHQIRSKGKS